ncbi:hypothetical protein [Denitrificimonas caeni]|uniref:hypothetical protein n=1 Tax=Denitrificimonas caeni TaxID=521720 RepID=UPI001963D9D5|nr:hypothetical protein [Denitrificimonas caeni]
MNKPDLKTELREAWNEFNQLIIKLTPDFIYKIYKNKPVFWLLLIFAITLEIVIGFWIYGYWITPQSEIVK